jgi:hypothetical protein
VGDTLNCKRNLDIKIKLYGSTIYCVHVQIIPSWRYSAFLQEIALKEI